MRFAVKFQETSRSFPVNFGVLQTVTAAPDVPIYDGPYVVTPKTATAQKLLTAQKYLTQNVSVQKIPFYEVDNTAGGTTIYIGSEDELIIE